jgi:hypothetical protein
VREGGFLCLGKGDQTSSFKNTTEFCFTELRKIGNNETRLDHWVNRNTETRKIREKANITKQKKLQTNTTRRNKKKT